MSDEYGKTLNLPKTDFAMKASLPQREPEILKKWKDLDIYNSIIGKNSDKPKYILHDGPPFANGDIHAGHTLNKILKDVVVKHKAMTGYCTPFIPGWDTHGLPIERQAIKKLKLNEGELNQAEFRTICRDFATKYVGNQKEQFKRLGVIGDWEHPYLTLEPKYEASQLRIFGEMVDKGFIYRGLKPVYWCTDCQTALAEAEIEYQEDTTESIYVKFKIVDDKNKIGIPETYFVIWTTTTWTLPGNVAIAVNPRFEYAVVRAGSEHYVIASELVEAAMNAAGISEYEIIKKLRGEELEYIECKHPFLGRNSIVILGEHVTLEAGTGCVHTAPGHGMEDYSACKNAYPELPIVVPVNANGVLNEEAGQFDGQYYAKANKTILENLKESSSLFASATISHQYPHCWRCHNPIIFRAAEQWFASIDDFKEDAIKAIQSVKWIPAWGEERMVNMIKDRADWCISRQRLWGMPIPIFYCEDCGEPILDVNLINHVSDIFAENGSNAWFELEASELISDGYTCSCGGKTFRKEQDTMDVWFDSGTSHAGVLEARDELYSPADIYLEGNDQYRGWFQSSLLTSVAHNGKAPYKTVLTHGFVIDMEGKKMSKSVGNGLPPLEIINEYGADILRLWAVSSDYQSDVKISRDYLKQLSEVYRKIRNTARFILGNMYDFNPNSDLLPPEELSELDNWALMRLDKLLEKVNSAYENFEYHILYHSIHNFCTVDMSNFYLDIIKDRIYTEAPDSKMRRASQTVMYTVLNALVKMLAPIISFTSDEIWNHLPKLEEEKVESVLLTSMQTSVVHNFNAELEAKWEQILEARETVLRALESARKDKLIGNSLAASVKIFATGKEYDILNQFDSWDLAQIFVVSLAEIVKTDSKELAVEVKRASMAKCPRCWMYTAEESKDENKLCHRCQKVVEKINS